MKKIIVCIAALGFLPSAFADTQYDSFNGGFVQWSASNNSNLAHFVSAPGEGRNGTAGLRYDTASGQNTGGSITNPVTAGPGERIVMRTDFKFSITSTVLTEAPKSGVNVGFFGLMVSSTPQWWQGPRTGIQICRRQAQGQIWAFKLLNAPWQEGWNNNSLLGFPDNTGTNAASSAWNTLELVLTPAGSNYNMQASVYDANNTLLGAPTGIYDSGIAVTNPVYGGYWNAFHLGTNDTGGANTILEGAKVDSILFDNFAFGTESLANVDNVSFEDVIGYEFTSEAGKTHRLQYSLNGTDFFNTGASVAGDGSVKALIDPAASSAGRSYRVTSD